MSAPARDGGADGGDVVGPGAVLDVGGLTGAAPGERATLLQVSTAFCAPCRTAHRVLARVAATVPGVRHVDVDVADAPGLAAALAVTSTPTVVVLDAAGRVVVRAQGVPSPGQVLAALARALPDGSTPSPPPS